jgi:acetylornithine/succinyldiaminopimelate/putrescine aminotransferase
MKYKYIDIKTKIPHPETKKILNILSKYEPKSMTNGLPIIWDRAEGFNVWDKWGNKFIDFTSTIFVTNSGHGTSEICSAIRKKITKPLLHSYTFPTEIRAKFVEKLIDITPDFCEKVFLLSSGSEACDCAVKLMINKSIKQSDSKRVIISIRGSMHGKTFLGEKLKGNFDNNKWVHSHSPNFYQLSPCFQYRNFKDDMTEILQKRGVKDIAGFMIESYQGWSAKFYNKLYIQQLVKFSRENNISVCFDEIQGGFGRTGKLFAYEHYEVEPDLLCLGKGLGGGIPISAVIGRKKFFNVDDLSSTHSGNPLCCGAALANINNIIDNNLVEEARKKGIFLEDYLNLIKRKYLNIITEINCKGLLGALIFKNSKIADNICFKAMEKGLLLVYTGRESIKIGCPLIIPNEALVEGITILDKAIEEVYNEL